MDIVKFLGSYLKSEDWSRDIPINEFWERVSLDCNFFLEKDDLVI